MERGGKRGYQDVGAGGGGAGGCDRRSPRQRGGVAAATAWPHGEGGWGGGTGYLALNANQRADYIVELVDGA